MLEVFCVVLGMVALHLLFGHIDNKPAPKEWGEEDRYY